MTDITKTEVKKTTIGGQALIEGILMRGPHKSAIVVRKPDKELAVKTDDSGSLSKSRLGKVPVIRGVVNFAKSMGYGMKALNYSADFFAEEEDGGQEKGKVEAWLDEKLNNPKAEKIAMGVATAIGIIIPIVLFILMPTLVAGFFGGGLHHILRNLIEGAIRIAAFLLFLFAVSKQKDIRRTFMYHGAEHKSIACYEAGEELTVENVRRHSKFHPRCGTSFLFVVMIISILLYSLFTWSNPFLRVALRLALLPVVVGLSYEVNRFAGRHDNLLTKVLRWPGLLLQRFTVFEPDDGMIEVGIKALELVIPEDGQDTW